MSCLLRLFARLLRTVGFPLPVAAGRQAERSPERLAEACLGVIARGLRYPGEGCVRTPKLESCTKKPIAGQIPHRRLAGQLTEPRGEGGPRHGNRCGELAKGPGLVGMLLQQGDGLANLRVPETL